MWNILYTGVLTTWRCSCGAPTGFIKSKAGFAIIVTASGVLPWLTRRGQSWRSIVSTWKTSEASSANTLRLCKTRSFSSSLSASTRPMRITAKTSSSALYAWSRRSGSVNTHMQPPTSLVERQTICLMMLAQARRSSRILTVRQRRHSALPSMRSSSMLTSSSTSS